MRLKLLEAMNGGDGRTDLVMLSRKTARAKLRTGLSGRRTGDSATANAERALGKASKKPLAPDLRAAFDADDLLLYGAARRSEAAREMTDGTLMRGLDDMVGARDAALML